MTWQQLSKELKTIALWTGWPLAILFALLMHLHYVDGFTGTLFSDSEPTGIYRAISGSVTRGSMVELRNLIKHVAAIPGDTVRCTPQGSFINDKLWPDSAIPSDVHSHPYPFGTYKLAPGQYWLLGRNPHSWDSRYLGPVPDDLIESPVKPFWTSSNGFAPGTNPWR
jgi:type IV secretory pathway protease TraF